MMKKIVIATAAVLALSVSSVFAVTAQTGFFLTGGLGAGQLDSPSKGFGSYPNFSPKNYGFAWNAGVGYQKALDQNFSMGLELAYSQLGKSNFNYDNGAGTTTHTAMENTAWELMANATYLWNSGFNVFVNAGAARVKQDLTGTVQNIDISSRDVTKTKFAAGLGVGYQLTQEFGVNVSWLHVFGANYSNLGAAENAILADRVDVASSNAYTLNLVYTLPA